MKFRVRDSFQNKGCLILAKRACQEFPRVAGLTKSGEIEKTVQYFLAYKVEDERKQDDFTSVISGDDALLLHLSNIHLQAKAKELGSTNAALLQWGKSLSVLVSKEKQVALPLIPGLNLAEFRLVLEGLWFGSYEFHEWKQKPGSGDVELDILASGELAYQLAEMLKDLEQQILAMQQTLKLVLSPANLCTPRYFSDFAAEQVRTLPNVRTEIWDEEKLCQEGMNLILGVGRGSPHESRLLILDYEGDSASMEHIALVGKGVCFDTGGTNLKASSGLKGMQYDMMGGAIVYGAFRYLASTGFSGNIKAYIPLVENQIGGRAIKTGDILNSAMGPSVEVNNTDAEGRLILADAIHYAVQQKPKLLVDCATLTGASIVALGEQCASFYSNDKKLALLFSQASEASGEDVWQMPLFRPYAGFLESKLADLSNISTKGRNAGSLTAALFLERFALQEGAEHSWLHLDMAGWSSLEEHPSLGKNAHTLGLRLLADFLRRYDKAPA